MSNPKRGIYKIYCVKNAKSYIGSSGNIERRWREHILALCRGVHHSEYLQNSWNKYGKSSFEFSVIEIVPYAQRLIEREQHWIDATPNRLNICEIAGSTAGTEFCWGDEAWDRAASRSLDHYVFRDWATNELLPQLNSINCIVDGWERAIAVREWKKRVASRAKELKALHSHKAKV